MRLVGAMDCAILSPLQSEGIAMRHFVGYHNEERMGYAAVDSNPLALYTSKKHAALGDLIWIIAGSGNRPKRYSLSSWFIVDRIAPADRSEFGSALSGSQGSALTPAPELTKMDWFREFRRRCANFSLGMLEITDPQVIVHLQSAAAGAGGARQ